MRSVRSRRGQLGFGPVRPGAVGVCLGKCLG
jgi:hypothetical protein